MNASEAALVKENGINKTAQKWIDKIQKNWEAILGAGWDIMWVENLNREVLDVQAIVSKHFKDLGYGFEEEVHSHHYYDEYHYRLRLVPRKQDKRERGIFSRLIHRIFGGSHD